MKHIWKKANTGLLILAASAMLLTGCGKKTITVSVMGDADIVAVTTDDEITNLTCDETSITVTLPKEGIYELNCTEETVGDFTLVLDYEKGKVTATCDADLDIAVGTK